MMRLEKRIRALEARLISDPVVLYFADGSTRELRGDLLHLFADACRGADLSPGQTAQMNLIRQCLDAQEPGGGRMVELVRCALNGPAEERGNRGGELWMIREPMARRRQIALRE